MLFPKFCQMRRSVFDQSSTVHPVSESRGGATLSVTKSEVRRTEILGSNFCQKGHKLSTNMKYEKITKSTLKKKYMKEEKMLKKMLFP